MLTVKQISKELKVSQWTVRRWINSGLLKAVKLPKSWRIREEDLEKFIEGG